MRDSVQDINNCEGARRSQAMFLQHTQKTASAGAPVGWLGAEHQPRDCGGRGPRASRQSQHHVSERVKQSMVTKLPSWNDFQLVANF